MNKLNNKGFGHHLLLIAVTTLALLGAAGFFVWNRQKDSNFDAKAAGYTYLNALTSVGGMGAAQTPKVDWYACKRLLPNGNYSVNVYAKIATTISPTVSAGYRNNDNYTFVYNKLLGSTLTRYQFPSFTIPSSNYLYVKAADKAGFASLGYYLKDITTC